MNHLLNHALSLLAGVPRARPFAAQVAHPARRLARSGIAHRVDGPPLRRFEDHLCVALRRRTHIAKELHDLLFIGKGRVIRAALELKRRFDCVFHLREHRIHRHDIRQVPAAFHQIAGPPPILREIFQHVDHVDQPPHDDRGERDAVARISLAICSKPACASAGLPSVMNITCLRFVPSNALSVSQARRSAPVNRVSLLGSAVSMLLIASSTGFLSPHRRHFHEHLRVV